MPPKKKKEQNKSVKGKAIKEKKGKNGQQEHVEGTNTTGIYVVVTDTSSDEIEAERDVYKQPEKKKSSIRRSGTSVPAIRPSLLPASAPTTPRQSRARTLSAKSSVTSTSVAEMDINQDILTLFISETTQKIIHCMIGKDLFVDKTWCLVNKSDLLEDIAIEDANSPFLPLSQKIAEYKPNEFMIGYEPFSTVPNQFMLCLTEAGRDEVVNRLQDMKDKFVRRIEQSKEVVPREWQSLGSEEFVNQFQIKRTRKLISLEWIGDITKRCFTEPHFEDCDPDDMKNGYTCLVPSEKEKYELVYRKTQETGVQAVASREETSVQTEPAIPTNASTQYAPETEISGAGTQDSAVASCEETSVQTEPAIPTNASTQYAPETEISGAGTRDSVSTVSSQDLNTFFKKHLDYLLECLKYNEVYDLYHDDYPALYVPGEETQVQQVGIYHQYQSFTDVAAVEGKLVVSTSWHPNYTGIVAIAYADEIPCLMTQLDFDSDQTDYEEEKTDDEGEGVEEPELSVGARNWLEDERRERESTSQNMELYDRAVKRLKDIEATKTIWDGKIQQATEEIRKTLDDYDSDTQPEVFQYKEYKEPEPEPGEGEGEGEIPPEATGSQVTPGEMEGIDEEEETFGMLGKDQSSSRKSSKASLREQLEAEVESEAEAVEKRPLASLADDSDFDILKVNIQDSGSINIQQSESASILRKSHSDESSFRRKTHHRKKHRQNVPQDGSRWSKQVDQESVRTQATTSLSTSTFEGHRYETVKDTTYYEQEYFDEVTDEEEMKEKMEELPLLEINNPVLVWSFVDDLTPKLRLDSPYEVRTVSFSRHDGNLIAGGTVSGQVVLWDITGRIEALEKPEALTQNQQTFRKRMEDLMAWRKDIRSKRRVPVSVISAQKESHLDKITSLVWVSPVVMVTNNADVIRNPTPDIPSLQILTSSIAGDIKVWDLRSDPFKVDNKKQLAQFKTKERFGRPEALDKDVSPHTRLHRRWKPHVSFTTIYKGLPVLLTSIDPHSMSTVYVRRFPKVSGIKEALEDRIEYKCVYNEFRPVPLQMYTGNLFGEAGTIMWEPPEETLPEMENLMHTCHFWDSYHDGPIHRVSKHPFIPSVCLTVGGHVFAIWHLDNPEDPIMTRRYYGVYVTDGLWSTLRPSMIRIARSDGVVEIWDLIIQTHAPATTIVVSGRVITNISPPLLPEVKGLLGVADYNSAFRLFHIPQQFRIWTEGELKRVTKMLNYEPERKKKMKKWSKWWRENNVNPDREEKKQAEEKKKMDEEVRLEKEKQEEARKKYNEEVYKWYMRRRGKPFMRQEEAEEKWRQKEEDHMHEVVMAKKKIDRSEMESLMKPIVREEKNETQKHTKAQERLKQADAIFRQTVDLIFPKTARKVSTTVKEEEKFNEEFSALIDHYYGENFETLADEQEEIIKRSPWHFDFEWTELLEKYNALRMLFNDRRRKRSKTLRWLRKKLRDELIKEGRKVHIRKSHMARYNKRKIKRRQDNFEMLKEMYGDDYNIYWDKHHPCRRFTDKKFRYPLEEMERQFLGELSEPDVEDDEEASLFPEEKVMSNLEMMTEMGIEHVPEETFVADLDTALITLDSRSSLGVKTIPSLFEKKYKKDSILSDKSIEKGTEAFRSIADEDSPTLDTKLQVPPGMQSPQDHSDTSMTMEEEVETGMAMDNQKEELDYIQQPSGTKINVLQIKTPASHQRHEISEGIKIKVEESTSEDEEVFGTEIEKSSKASIIDTQGKEDLEVGIKVEVSKGESKELAVQEGEFSGPEQDTDDKDED